MPPEHDDTDALLKDLESEIGSTDTDSLLKELEAHAPQLPQKTEAPGTPPPATEANLPWYHPEKGVMAGAVRGFMGNLGTQLADKLLPQRDTIDGIPATYGGATPGQTLESNFQQEKAAHPYQVGAGQALASIPAAYLGARAGAGLAVTGGEAALGAGLGGMAPVAAEKFNEAVGSPGQRFGQTEQYFDAHPTETATGVALPAVGEAVAPALKAVAKPLIDYGNRGLARIGLSGSSLGRILAEEGKPGLANAGAAMREAGLNKPRKLLDYFSPPDAEQMALNAHEVTQKLGGPKGRITQLENTMANTTHPDLRASDGSLLPFGETEISRDALKAPLLDAARDIQGSAASHADRTVKALRKQAGLFDKSAIPQDARPDLIPPAAAPIRATATVQPPAPPSPATLPALPPPSGGLTMPEGMGTAVEYTPPPELTGRSAPQQIPDADFSSVVPPATAQTQVPYTFNNAVRDQRAIGNQLFAQDAPLFQQRVGEKKASEIAWQALKDAKNKRIDEGLSSGVLNPQNVSDYKAAMRQFGPAADVAIDAGREAGRSMKRPESLVRGAASYLEDAAPQIAHGIGRGLQKTADSTLMKLAPSIGQASQIPEDTGQHRGITSADIQARNAEVQNKQKQQANEALKQSLFQRWYNKLGL